MWKPDIAKNINLNSHRSAKKGHKPGRPLRMETLETRTMFYADPLTLSMPDTSVLVGEPEPAGPLPELFLQKQGRTPQINPSQIDRNEPQNAPVALDPYANDGNLFPLGRPTPPNRYVPTPIGVFPDGSARTVHPEIDPIVVEYMDNQYSEITRIAHLIAIGISAIYGLIVGTLIGIPVAVSTAVLRARMTTMLIRRNHSWQFIAPWICSYGIFLAPAIYCFLALSSTPQTTVIGSRGFIVTCLLAGGFATQILSYIRMQLDDHKTTMGPVHLN